MDKLNLQILTPQQQNILDLLSNSKLSNSFYLSGGTALIIAYIPYRYSDDLDFFSETDFEFKDILSYLMTLKKQLNYKNIDFRTNFNRNLVFIEFNNSYILKLEFTYYPFMCLESGTKLNQLGFDSIIDIATNKLFTIYQNPRYRDFTDLYLIMKRNNTLTFEELIKKARLKFDWHIDLFQLGKQLLKVEDKIDIPRFIGDFDQEACKTFFLDQALFLKQSILR